MQVSLRENTVQDSRPVPEFERRSLETNIIGHPSSGARTRRVTGILHI